MRGASKHDSGFYFNRPAVSQVGLEFPLFKGVGDGFCLVGKCA